MLYGDFPIGNMARLDNPKTIDKMGFYYAVVESNLALPILPYRCKERKKLLFPNGTFGGLY
jgi:hypothetical protein